MTEPMILFVSATQKPPLSPLQTHLLCAVYPPTHHSMGQSERPPQATLHLLYCQKQLRMMNFMST